MARQLLFSELLAAIRPKLFNEVFMGNRQGQQSNQNQQNPNKPNRPEQPQQPDKQKNWKQERWKEEQDELYESPEE